MAIFSDELAVVSINHVIRTGSQRSLHCLIIGEPTLAKATPWIRMRSSSRRMECCPSA